MKYLGKIWFSQVPSLKDSVLSKGYPIGLMLDAIENENDWTGTRLGPTWAVFFRGRGLVKVHVSSSSETTAGTLLVHAVKVWVEEWTQILLEEITPEDELRAHLKELGWIEDGF